LRIFLFLLRPTHLSFWINEAFRPETPPLSLFYIEGKLSVFKSYRYRTTLHDPL